MTAGLFRDADAALRFAYRVERFDVLPRAGSARCGRGAAPDMTLRDWKAQGALIRRHLAKLPPHGQRYVQAFYGLRGDKAAAQRWLLQLPEVAACFDGLAAGSAGVRDVLARYCSDDREDSRESLRSLGRRLDVHHTTVMRAELRLKAALSRLFSDVEARILGDFERMGLVDSDDGNDSDESHA